MSGDPFRTRPLIVEERGRSWIGSVFALESPKNPSFLVTISIGRRYLLE